MMNESKRTPADKGQRDLTWLIILFFAIVWIAFVHSRAYSTNESSRLASIESLVHRGTWAIDESTFSHTQDKIRVGERFFSSKPPTLSFLGAGIYWVLHEGLDQTLFWRECVPDRTLGHCRAIFEPDKTDWSYVALVLLLVSLPATIALVLVYRTGLRNGMPNWASLLIVLVLGTGTALFPYSTVFSNHPLAATGIVVATYILLNYPEPKKWQLAVAGFAATLSATADLSAAIYLVGLFVFVLLSHRQQVTYFVLGGLAPGLLAIGLNLAITGTPLPPQLYTQGYDYPGSVFLTNPGGHRASQNTLAYTFHLLVGERGLFSFYPIALWFVYALVTSLGSPNLSRRRLAWVIGLSTLGYVLYFALRTHSYGGFAFGTRWLLNPIPVLALFALDPALYRPRLYLKAAIVGLLGLVSIAGTFRGALNPWGPARPLVRLTYEVPIPREFITVAISGHDSYEEAVEPAIRESYGANTVLRRWFDARSGLVVPDGDSWWFIDESTPMDPRLAEPFGLNQQNTIVLKADLSDEAARWLESFEQSAYHSPELSPSPADSLNEVKLPVSYEHDGDKVTLLGYRLERVGDVLTLLTAWRVDERTFPVGARKIFVHLLAADGQLVGQDDSFSARYDALFPGDVFFQSQRLSLNELGPGTYWLQMGLYDPDSGARLTAAGSDRLLLDQVRVGAPDKPGE